MPGVHSNVSEMMQLSRLSPEIPRIDILEHEHESQMGNTLFDMFGTQFSLSGASNASYNSSSSHDKSMFSEIAIFPEATKVVHENGNQVAAAREQAGEHGFDSFQFLRRSMFDGKEKELEDPQVRQASPSSGEIEAEAPIARLWTEYDPHCSDDGGSEQQHTSYEHHRACGSASISTEKSLDNSNNSNVRASLKANSSWGISRSSSGLEPTTTKPKRKRSRPCKSSEEVESQRMTHIAVERNRRKQMNEHLRVLRSLMPGSYVQRGDQASIIGGAIEFVKELQQLLQCLEEQKKRKMAFSEASPLGGGGRLGPSTIMQAAAGFPHNGHRPTPLPPPDVKYFDGGLYEPLRELYGEAKSELADVEVKIVGMGAFIKILSQRKPGQLLKTMTALEHKLSFTILHTNVTTIEQTVLYSFEVKVGPECTLAVDDIATFIHHTLATTHNGPEEL